MNENVNVCITPKGDKPVLHFSQFDNERAFTVTVLADDGESAVDLTDLDIEFRLRKTDSHVVTIAPISVVSNVITFLTTEQLCACCGQNIASVVIMNNDSVISTLDILVDIQRDILSGGLTSESDIRNLTTQIETIIPEVLADDYYTKTEVDDLIDEIPTFDPTNYYDKSDVDSLLADKADVSDLPDMSDYYTKGETDTLLLDKADKSDVYTKAQTDSLLFFKVDKINEKTASDLPSAIALLTDAGNDCPLSALTVAVSSGKSSATIGRCGVNLVNVNNFVQRSGYSNLSASISGSDISVSGYNSGGRFACFYALTEIGKTYTVKFTNSTGVVDSRVQFSDTEPTEWISGGASFFANKTLTFTSTKTWCMLWFELNADAIIMELQLEQNLTPTEYTPYISQTETISFGTTLTQAGVLDVISGLLTLEDESTIQCTGVEIDTKTGINHVFCDTGNILTLKYFGFNAEDLFRYIRLIKG